MPFIPTEERPSLALLARLDDERATALADALRTASEELGGDELLQHVIKEAPSVPAEDVKRILTAVRQIASAREILEVRPEVFLDDIAEGMGAIEGNDFRLGEAEQRCLRERLAALTESSAMAIHAKTRSLQQGSREHLLSGSYHHRPSANIRFRRTSVTEGGSCGTYAPNHLSPRQSRHIARLVLNPTNRRSRSAQRTYRTGESEGRVTTRANGSS